MGVTNPVTQRETRGQDATVPAATPADESSWRSLMEVARERQHQTALRRFLTGSPLGAIAGFLLLFALMAALIGPYVGAGDPEALNALSMFKGPTWDLPMGGDYLGRGVLARIVAGLRVSLALAAISAVLAASVGIVLGLMAGYFGSWVDQIVMRFADILFAFPIILLGLLTAIVLEPGVTGVIVTIVIATVPVFARVTRGPTLSVRNMEYTVAARVIGASSPRILLRYILPNVSTPLLVQLASTLSAALIVEGALSFLGLGVQPPRPSLGSLLRDGKTYMELAPWMMIFPGLTLALAIFAVNLLADELQAFTDPRLKRR